MASLRSRSSGSSTSSLSSTFSDITSSTSATSSPPPISKTNAFFTSPFSTRSPSPEPAQQPSPTAQSTRSLTEDFFATPMKSSSSPPLSPMSTTKPSRTYFSSRIFPSRYTSGTARRNSELQFGEKEYLPPSTESDSSILENTRLPTPPPPLLVSPGLHQQETINAAAEAIESPTPRPQDAVPAYSLLLSNQKPELAGSINDDEGEKLEPGFILSIPSSGIAPSPVPSPVSFAFTIAPPSSFLPADQDGRSPTPKLSREAFSPQSLRPSSSIQSLSSSSPKVDQEPFHSALSIPTSALRLLKPLGHGTFSSVWLGEDLGLVPLAVLSKKCVRDLRRRASTKHKDRGKSKSRQDDRESEPRTVPIGKSDKGPEEPTKRAPSRLRDGLRNMFSRTGSSTVTSQPTAVAADPLSRRPTLPSHSPTSSISSDDFSAMSTLPSRLPSSDSSTSIMSSPSSNLSLNLRVLHGDIQASSLSRDSSLRKFRERVSGTRPGCRFGRTYLDESDGDMGEPRGSVADVGLFGAQGLDARRSSLEKDKEREKKDRLVAVKVTPRRVTGSVKNVNAKEEEERTRVRFVREVEVLKHISHPNITPLLAHLSTSNYHILVLPYLPGGDLLDLVNSDVAWGKLGESVLRRIWFELCKAVGWMHGVGLVHRDIKLENILLTTAAFSNITPTSSSYSLPDIPPVPSPFIKLTDFGLSRFVEIDEATGEAELLTTRCGSEAYAAPELVIAGRAGYDARKTDAWSCGVVLYALVGRKLPFGEGVGALDAEEDRRAGSKKERASALAERRHWLMMIAKGEWVWPGDEMDDMDHEVVEDEEGELVGHKLVKSKGARRIVERLLVRDTRKRARIADLWSDPWMSIDQDSWKGIRNKKERPLHEPSPFKHPLHEMVTRGQNPGLSQTIIRDFAFEAQHKLGGKRILDDQGYGRDEPLADGDFLDEEDEGGCLLDHEGIDSITRQEVL